jgi:hypothetical protein
MRDAMDGAQKLLLIGSFEEVAACPRAAPRRLSRRRRTS